MLNGSITDDVGHRTSRSLTGPLVDLLTAERRDGAAQPDVGLSAAERLGIRNTAIVFHVCSSARTMGDALLTLARYAPLIDDGLAVELTVAAGSACLKLRHIGGPVRAISDYLVGATWRFLRPWYGPSLGAWFHYPKPISRQAFDQHMSGATLRFNAPYDAVVLDASRMSQRLPTAEPDLHMVLVECANDQLARVAKRWPNTLRARTVMNALMSAGILDATGLSTKLGMSRRSLSRRLMLEGTSYSELLESIRRELADHMLTATDLPIHEIARRLGYTSTATMCRAFRRWQGVSANTYRRMARDGEFSASDASWREVAIESS